MVKIFDKIHLGVISIWGIVLIYWLVNLNYEIATYTVTPIKTTSILAGRTILGVAESKVKKETNIIDINRATISQLCKIKGIGKVKAERIVEYRKENGSFKSVDELLNIKGIGVKTLKKIKQQKVTIGSKNGR